ncbi:MAG: DnaJ C-terminal domain-containing protein [Betaproteobacteria bacterium]
MKFKDYYEVMGVERTATQDEIKRAYRKLARKYHPDVSKEADAEARFKEVGEAYEVLKDPEKRAAYDRVGSQWKNGQDFEPPPNWNGGGAQFDAGEFGFGGGEHSDFFESLFGRRAHGAGGPRARTQAAGRDSHAQIEIDLEDAYRGAQRTISLRMPVMDTQGNVVAQERKLDVTIPKGVRAGQHLRLAGQGSPGFGGGPAGDLYLEIAFRPVPHFRVEGRDVYMDLPLAPWEAALGATVTATTPDGPVQLTVPPGSRVGRKLRLKGRGIPGKHAGDLYAELSIVLPPADTHATKAAYRAFELAFDFDPRASLKGEPS